MTEPDKSATVMREMAHLKLNHARARYDSALRDYMGALTAFEEVFKNPIKPASRKSSSRAKIALDDELRAFVEARLNTLTLQQIVDEVDRNFPPHRRTSVSALQRWNANLDRHLEQFSRPNPTDKS